jgi:hypothetical protein
MEFCDACTGWKFYRLRHGLCAPQSSPVDTDLIFSCDPVGPQEVQLCQVGHVSHTHLALRPHTWAHRSCPNQVVPCGSDFQLWPLWPQEYTWAAHGPESWAHGSCSKQVVPLRPVDLIFSCGPFGPKRYTWAAHGPESCAHGSCCKQVVPLLSKKKFDLSTEVKSQM